MEYIRYLNLPKVPTDILNNLPLDITKYDYILNAGSYKNSSSFNEEVLNWCNEYVSPNLDWRFQFIDGKLEKHVDVNIIAKFLYLFDTGGQDVKTQFWSNDGKSLLREYNIEPYRWCILKVNVLHSVIGVNPGCIRKAIVGWIF
jgi:hypothetical protein